MGPPRSMPIMGSRVMGWLMHGFESPEKRLNQIIICMCACTCAHVWILSLKDQW